MKLRIELEIDLGDNFINPNDKEERDWLFNHVLTESNLFLHDNEIGDTIGDIKKVIKCEEVQFTNKIRLLKDNISIKIY